MRNKPESHTFHHKTMRFLLPLYLILFYAGIHACAGQGNGIPIINPAEFADQWYQGKAEITSYQLQQARYGDIHPGEAVLIFVTEDFSREKQVKLDNPAESPDDAVKIMKLNAMRSFRTGIYEYNLMRSVFTPVENTTYPNSMKVTGSFQDWCGQSWMQYNLDGNRYHVRQFSYFESEGDRDFHVDNAMLEDEIWTLIRTAPHTLPVGEISMIPGIFFTRLRHRDGKPEKAMAQLQRVGGAYTYSIAYPEFGRTLSIHFEDRFPYEISGWEEVTRSGFGEKTTVLTTRATVQKRIMSDYWKRNNPSDRALRAELGLSTN